MTRKQVFLSAIHLLFVLAPLFSFGQQTQQAYSLEDCYQAAKQNLPLLRNTDLIAAQAALQQANLDAQRLPRLQLIANGSFQSENISLQFPPNLPIEGVELPLYRAQLYAEAQYVLYDGGRLQAAQSEWQTRTAQQQASLAIPEEEVIKQVQQLFFSIHLLQKQEEILQTGLKTLHEREQALQNAIAAGAALESQLLEWQGQILQTESQLLQIQQNKNSALRVLSLLTALNIKDSKQLKRAEETAIPPEPGDFSQRAQMKLFALRQTELEAQNRILEAKRKPTLATFAKAGIGYPNPLNFFDENISPYGIIGLQLSWQPIDWKQTKRKKEMLQLQSQSILNERDQLQQQYLAEDAQLREQIKRYKKQIDKDKELLQLRQQLVEEADIQLKQGVITTTDYLLRWNALQQSKLQLEWHQLQKMQTQHLLHLLHHSI